MSNLKYRFSLLVVLSIAGYGLSFCNQLIVSYYFGTSSSLDTYWAALAIANLLCFYLHPFKEALVPAVHAAAEKNIVAAGKTLSAGLSLLLLLIIISTFLLWFFPQGLAKWLGNSQKTSSNLADILPWFLPFLCLFVLSETLNSILVSFDKVLYQAVVRLIAAIASLGFIALTGANLGVKAMVVALLASQVIVIFMSWYELRQYPIVIRVDAIAVLRKEKVFVLFGSLLVSYFIAQIYILSERAVMVSIKPGLVAAFQYSTSLVNVLISILAVPLSNLLWHRFLHARVTGDYAKAGELAAKAAGLLFILLMLICVFSYINAKQIVYIVFSRGAFDEISLALTTQTFQSTIFAAIPIGVASVFGRFLISINHPKYLAIIGVSIAISGLAVIYTAKYYDSSIIIQWHWLIGNFIGLLLCLIIFIKKCKFHISEIYTSVKWLLFVSTVVALSALITPEIIFGIGKIDVLLALILNFSIFITVAFFIAYVSGLLNQIKLFLKLTV